MIQANPQSQSCSKCRGCQYLLTNVKGLLFGEHCSCFSCDVCGGRGQIFEEDASGVSTLKECSCAVLTQRLAKLNAAGIPGKFAGTQFETFNPVGDSQKQAKSRARDFVRDFGKTGQGLMFMGRPGLGKTHLAVSVIKALVLEWGADCKFIDFFQLLSDIRYGYSQDLSEQAIIHPYVQAQVLVIDELAKGRNTEWELTMLDQIISSRYNAADKITLVTTNYMDVPTEPERQTNDSKFADTQSPAYRKNAVGEETLQDKVGERIFSRLVEMCQIVKLQGQDYRQEVLAQYPIAPKSRKR